MPHSRCGFREAVDGCSDLYQERYVHEQMEHPIVERLTPAYLETTVLSGLAIPERY